MQSAGDQNKNKYVFGEAVALWLISPTDSQQPLANRSFVTMLTVCLIIKDWISKLRKTADFFVIFPANKKTAGMIVKCTRYTHNC